MSCVTRAMLSTIAAARWLDAVSSATLPMIVTTSITTCPGAIRHAHLPESQRYQRLHSHKAIANNGSDKRVNKQQKAELDKKRPAVSGSLRKRTPIFRRWSPRVAKLAYNVSETLGWFNHHPKVI